VLIDWFTVAAQIVNFLILMALLKIFLYDRIIRAMDEREENIRSRLQEAQEKRDSAEEEARSYREQKKELEGRREKLLSEAKKEADERREELEDTARREIETLRGRWREGLEKEHAAFVRRFRQMAGRRTLIVARTILADLADTELEKRVVEVFADGMRRLDEAQLEKLRRSAAADRDRLRVFSAFEMAADERRKVTRIVHETIGKDLEVEYDRDPDLLLGVVLKTAGEKVAWNVHDYLKALTEDVQAAVESETRKGEEKDTPARSDSGTQAPDEGGPVAKKKETDEAD
jgi:F-type H+-transporting ATPase subunit b